MKPENLISKELTRVKLLEYQLIIQVHLMFPICVRPSSNAVDLFTELKRGPPFLLWGTSHRSQAEID